MTQHDALIRAVCENPDDDLPRLVFADWLEENGEPERAEFIRAMCRLEKLYTAIDREAGEAAVAEMNRLDPRAWEVWQHRGRDWLDELPHLPGITWPYRRWRRGFPGEVLAETAGHFVKHATVIAAKIPLTSLTIRRMRGVTTLLRCPCLRTLRVLILARAGLTDRMAEAICESSSLDRLDRLIIGGNHVSREWVRQLENKFGDRLSSQDQGE